MTLQQGTAGLCRRLYRDAAGERAGPAPPGYAGQRGAGRASPRRGAAASFSDGRDVSGRVPLPFFFFLDYRINADCRTPHPRGAAATPRAPSSPDPPERGDTAAGGAGGRVPPALPARVPPPGAAGLSQPAPQPREGGMLHRAGVAGRAPRPGPSTARVKPPGKRGDTKEN